MSVRSCSLITLFKSSIYLLISNLVVLSVAEKGMLESPVSTGFDCFSFQISINFCFMYFGALMLGVYIVRTIMSFQ